MLLLSAGYHDLPAPEFLNLRTHPVLHQILWFARDCRVPERKNVKVSRSDIESVIGCLNFRPEETQTSLTCRNYSLEATRSADGLVIKWYKKNTREPLEIDGIRG